MRISDFSKEERLELTNVLPDLKGKVDPDLSNGNFVEYVEMLIDNSKGLQQLKKKLLEIIFGPNNNGYFLADLSVISQDLNDRKLINFLLLCCVGKPIWLADNEPLWFELKVKTDVDAGKTHGIGENKLHMDMVGYSHIPRVISLHSVRKDIHGGGASFLADLNKAVNLLSEEDIKILRSKFFKYWGDDGARNVGENLESFSIIDTENYTNETIYRFTSKAYYFMEKDLVFSEEGLKNKESAVSSFKRLWIAAEAIKEQLILQPGQFLMFNQLRLAHGRGVLGPFQVDIPENERRSLLQAYAH